MTDVPQAVCNVVCTVYLSSQVPLSTSADAFLLPLLYYVNIISVAVIFV